MTDFPGFFKALWSSEGWPNPEPFPWQTMLAERAAKGDWPGAIDLPTASGKTACLDAAIFGLAATASAANNRLPRRIWFVVDRRIVVDEAFRRANAIASKLQYAAEGSLKELADLLRNFGGNKEPLAVARLRGGAWQSKNWSRRPSQPTIICSTVDQIGSALLFRSYGHSDQAASVYAGLVAHDSLILLDEAHCAVPFMQTLSAVERFRGDGWAERPLGTPFRFCIMSATPPRDIQEQTIFPGSQQRDAALNHPRLQQRLTARKPTSLVSPVKGDDNDFASTAARHARKYVDQGKRRVAVMVNRVATAQLIADHLRQSAKEASLGLDVVLLTGRMRPLDRDTIINGWESKLKSGSAESLERPVIVVTTQCLEVGADFSFDALVTECASLDALRQRFGRLDRLGELHESAASILIRERDAKVPKDDGDPIYGKAIYETWTWLNAVSQSQAGGVVDFGVAALDARINALRLTEKERLAKLYAPALDAPVLLPAHLDSLCQTSPRPVPEPDVTLFLHGKGRAVREVLVVFRADLPIEEDDAIDYLSLAPPASPEMLTVPLYRLTRWLLQQAPEDPYGDVEGFREEQDQREEIDSKEAAAPFLIWRGRERSELAGDVGRLRPNDVVVLRLPEQWPATLGQTIENPQGLGPSGLDLAEHALTQARGRVVLRVRTDVLGPLCQHPSVANLVELAKSDPDFEEIRAALVGVLEESVLQTRPWLETIVRNLCDGGFRMEDHPTGGLVLIGKTSLPVGDADSEDDPNADSEDLTSRSVVALTLRQHAADVRAMAEGFAARCLGDEFASTIAAAAQAHDLGKIDSRFQLLLHGGDELAVGEPLAKSAEIPERRRKRTEVTEDARLPKGFRHEFLSMELADRLSLAPDEGAGRELALHLIASHHGYARPFAPIVPDEMAGDLCLRGIGVDVTLSTAERQAWVPAHRLDSGVPDRFWRLTRRYGWWGLAYLECVLRLADWEASRLRPGSESVGPPATSESPSRPHSSHRDSIALDALDGANPLAFLAALGTLRVLTRVLPQHNLAMSWSPRLGAWRPLLWTAKPLDQETIVKLLLQNSVDFPAMFSVELLNASEAASPKNKAGKKSWKDKLRFPVESFRDFCSAVSESPSVRGEFGATWAGETVSTGEDDGRVALRTRFDFTAGQQAFIGMLRELRETCRDVDLRRSLFTGWRYAPTAVSMRWDTQDEKRQYALQSVDPTDNSKNPPTADSGANLLAVEALPLFPLMPNRRASQAGFDSSADGRSWSWPIWTCPAGLDAVRSLLTLPLADSRDWSVPRRRALGVATVFQSRIVQPSGRYRCFTPARSL